ncbi:MAG: class I SAM-dependent rRNA methyltransferase [Myxococcales bacterium]|nr:class I SAM-dependent rRNA methyltransferase [Myxococcales bacterium]
MIRLTPKGLRRWRTGHPWIFRNDLAGEATATPGDLVRVHDAAGRPLGRAAWSEASLIALRRVPVELDEDAEAAWDRLVDAALARRADARPSARLINGDADGLPGLIVDRFGDGLSLQTLTPAADRRRDALVAKLVARYAPRVVALRNDPKVRDHEGLPREKALVHGDDAIVWAPFGDLVVRFDLLEGQKTGGFLDQQENQVAAAAFARPGKALDCFAYQGGFALALARAGLAVTAVDQSGPALAHLRANAERNGLAVEAVEANVFDLLRDLEREGALFDTIVLDPPAFVPGRKAIEAGRRAYKEINLRALKLLVPGGRLVTCSCSAHMARADFERMVGEAAADAGRFARVIERRGPGPDHPTLITAPETDYLKALFVEVL